MPPYNNADKYYGHTLSGYSDKIEIELSARTEALKNASWPVNDAESSKANIAQNENNNNSNFEENIRQSEKARALAEEIKKVDGQLQGYDAINEAIAANIEKEFGTMEYNAENLEKIKKYAGLKNSYAQNLDEVLEEIKAGKLQEGERAFLRQLKGNLIQELGKEIAEESARGQEAKGSAEEVDGIPRIATLPRNDSNNTVAQHDTTAEGIGYGQNDTIRDIRQTEGDRLNNKKFALRDAKVPTTYNELIAKPDVEVVDIRESYGKSKKEIKNTYKENKAYDTPIINKDTGEKIFFNEASVKHSISNAGIKNIYAAGQMQKILENAVLAFKQIDAHERRKTDGIYMFFGAVRSEDGIEPVKITVKEYKTKNVSDLPENIKKYFEKGGREETFASAYDNRIAGKVFNVESIEKVGKIPVISSSLSENQTGDKGQRIFPTKVSVAQILENVNDESKKYVLGTEENAEHQKALEQLKEEREATTNRNKNVNEETTARMQAQYRQIIGKYAGERTVKIMDKLAKRLGSEVIYYLGDDSSEGFYEDGKIYLNANLVDVGKNSGQNLVISGQQAENGTNANYWKIFKHEFTHAIEDSKVFKKDFTDWALASGLYSEFIKNQGFIDEEGNADKAAYADSIRELYRKNGQELDDNGLNRELMAKFVQESDLFENEESINRLVNENRGFGQRILEWIRNTINKIKGVDPTAENMLKEAERLYTKAVRETEKKGARNSGKQSSIETNSKGKYVKESRDIPFGDIEEEWNADAGNYIYDNILNHGELNVIADDGQILTIDGQTVYKLEGRDKIKANGVERLQNADEYKRKLTMAGHIDELAQISQQENKTPVKDRKDHLIARDGFNYRKAYFEDKNGNFYRLTVSVGKNGEVQTVYNINRINQLNKKGNTAKVRGSIPETGTPQGGVSNKNVSQQNKKVNTQGNKNLKKPDTAIARAMEKAKADKRQYSFRQTNEELAESRMNAKAQSYTNKAVNKLLKSFKDSVGMTTYADKGIKDEIRQFANEYVEKGGMSEEEVNKVFDKLYENAMTFNTEYYDQYKDLKKALRTTKINIGAIKGTVAKDLGRGLRWSYDKGALGSDSFYQELSEQYPELFPENIINPEDQLERMRDVAESIKPTEERLRDLGINYGSSVEERAREAFNTAVEDMNESLADVINFKRERGKRAEAKEQRRAVVDQMHTNIKETKKIFSESKDLNKKLAKLKNRYLWTEADGNALQRVLNGEITLEELPKNANKKAVNAVYETAKAAAETDQRLKDYKRGVAEQRRDMARELTINSNKYVDKKSGFQWESETPDRNFEDLAKETGDGKKLAEAYIKPIHENEAKATRMKNDYRKRLSEFKLDTKPKYEIRSVDVNGNPVDKLVSESGLVQAYGEGIINDRDLENFKARILINKAYVTGGMDWNWFIKAVKDNIEGEMAEKSAVKVDGKRVEVRRILKDGTNYIAVRDSNIKIRYTKKQFGCVYRIY